MSEVINKPADKLVLENATIIYRNFGGMVSQYNPEGKRNFCVLLTPAQAEKLKAEGWNVRYNDARLEGMEPQAYMQVTVAYNHFPPTVNVVRGKSVTALHEEDVSILDWAEIHHCDIQIRPYHWEVNGNKGVKGYLKTLFAVLEEDPLTAKYEKLAEEGEAERLAEKEAAISEEGSTFNGAGSED